MAKKPDFDVQASHKYFSANCFNNAWGLIDKDDRTAADEEQMLLLGMASLWHWTQREDCTLQNMSVGYWQVSRIYAVLGEADNARKFGKLCLTASEGEDIPPFYLGYAFEALARAESVAGNSEKMENYLQEARRVAESIPKPDYKKMLLDDLETIK